MDPSKHTLKVLIAEDHFPVRQLIASAVRSKNVTHVDAATDGKKAREMIDEAAQSGAPYHVIFLDWEMPVFSGIDILKHYRAQPKFADTAFIMVTSISVQANVLDAVKSGATAYMVKPVSQGAIVKKFEEVLVWIEQRKKLAKSI